jgi:hypothetical protein
MADVDAAIHKYIETDIALGAKDISACAASREWFLTRLKNEIVSTSAGPQLYTAERFIRFGSYFKGTKVRDVDEFDILVVIDSNTGYFHSGGRTLGSGQGSEFPNHKYDERFFKPDGSGVSPAKMLEWLRLVVARIVDSFGGEAPIRDGQAITARIASRDLAIDLVPAGVFEHANNGTVFYNIPKGNAADGWTLTSPRGDIEILNRVADGKADFRNVIRIAKRVRDTYGIKLPSFAIETAIVDYGRATSWTKSVSLEVVYAFRHLARAIQSGVIADPYDSSSNLIGDVADRAGCAKLFSLMADYVESLRNAKDQPASNTYAAVRDAFEAKRRSD